ncbi:hypothetical protein BBP40_012006 [Aspergillus hancockii]|nr:hypothetical protein BBP40_012006 [Aspergillus hancockii]
MSSIASKAALFESPSTPRSSHQWKAALEGVKCLYIKEHYKQCAAKAVELLEKAKEPIHPVHKTYLYFYSAASYEGMGRSAHKYSTTKIPLLRCALEYYVTCSAALPSAISVSETSSERSSPISVDSFSSSSVFSESPSPAFSLVASITDIIDKSIQYADDDPFVSVNDPCEGQVSDAMCAVSYDATNHLLVPPPLKPRNSFELRPLRMAAYASDQTAVRGERPARAQLPPPLPFKIVPLRFKSEITDARLSDRDSQQHIDNQFVNLNNKTTPVTPRRADAIKRYNRSLQDLRSQVESAIVSVQIQIDESTEKQHVRKVSKSIRRSASFWSFSPVKDGESEENKIDVLPSSPTNETMKQRIARLRADGWETHRSGGGLLASAASAIEIDIADPQSIQNAASTTTFTLMSNYTSNHTGNIHGIMDDSWWESAVLYRTLIQHWFLTGDASKQCCQKTGIVDHSNPNVFNLLVARWDTDNCGGGLRWQIWPFQAGYATKNAASNGDLFELAARLARYTGNKTYEEWAEKVWDWTLSSPLMNNETWTIAGSSFG